MTFSGTQGGPVRFTDEEDAQVSQCYEGGTYQSRATCIHSPERKVRVQGVGVREGTTFTTGATRATLTASLLDESGSSLGTITIPKCALIGFHRGQELHRDRTIELVFVVCDGG
jgi:hypothetical protein